MPLNIRPIAVSIAVTCFFGVSLIASISGHSPFVCCKRALVGGVLAYFAASWAVKAVNAILISAMATIEMNQQEENNSDNGD